MFKSIGDVEFDWMSGDKPVQPKKPVSRDERLDAEVTRVLAELGINEQGLDDLLNADPVLDFSTLLGGE